MSLTRRFLLFAAGGPDHGDDGRAIARRLRRQTGVLPGTGADLHSPVEPQWEFPVEQRSCILLVEEIAATTGDEVRVIDVNQPGEDRRLVERWAGPEAVLPLLVSPLGRRLEGAESFRPKRVRQFLGAG